MRRDICHYGIPRGTENAIPGYSCFELQRFSQLREAVRVACDTRSRDLVEIMTINAIKIMVCN